MPRIVAAIKEGSVVLIEESGTFYQVSIYWEKFPEFGVAPPEVGTRQVYPYEATMTASSEEMAWKWENWEAGVVYDEEMPPPPEVAEMVSTAWDNYKAGKGYQPC